MAAPAAARPGVMDVGLSFLAMILSLLVVGYLAWLMFG
jgi:hypothetical protein